MPEQKSNPFEFLVHPSHFVFSRHFQYLKYDVIIAKFVTENKIIKVIFVPRLFHSTVNYSLERNIFSENTLIVILRCSLAFFIIL